MNLDRLLGSAWFVRSAKAAAALLAVWALLWAVVPGLLKGELEKVAGERLGRKVSLGSVDFRPWSLEIDLNDLQIADAAGTTPQLKVSRIHLDVELQSLVRLAPVIDDLQIEGAELKLTRYGDGRYDVDDILQRLTPTPASQPDSPPPRFVFYNVAVLGGAVDWVDETVHKTHQLRDLKLTMPFLSSLESQREVLIEPRLAFRLNGASFNAAAQMTPFAPSHKSDVAIQLADLDLAPYLPYLPPGLPLQLQAGVLGTKLRLAFEQAGRATLKLSGEAELKAARIADARSQGLFAFDALRIDMEDVRPLEQVVKLASVDLSSPQLELRRDKGGRINILSLTAGRASPRPVTSQAGSSAPAPEEGSWQVDVAKLAVHAGRVRWTDEVPTTPVRLDAHDLALQVAEFGLPWRRPAKFEGSFSVARSEAPPRVAAPSAVKSARIGFKGEATDQNAALTADIQDFSLSLAAPYAAQIINPALAGNLTAQLRLQWAAPNLRLQVPHLVLDHLRLGAQNPADRTWPLAVERLELRDGQVEPALRSVTLGKIALTRPSLALERGADKRWMFERWLKSDTARAVSVPSVAAPAKPWRATINELALEAASIRLADRGAIRPVRLEVSALNLQMQNLATDSAKPATVKLAARVRSRSGDPGRLDFTGSLALQPMTLQGKLGASRLPLHALSPYLGDTLNVALLRADAGFRGRVRYSSRTAGPSVLLSGTALLEDVVANTLPVSDGAGQDMPIGQELLSWKALGVEGLEVALAPGQATRVTVAGATLTDFYARVIVNENGRINLQDIVKAPAPDGAASAAATPAPLIRMGPLSLVNGRVQFSDHFIKPNYSADLTEVTGRLGAFASAPIAGDAAVAPAMADLELRGRAEGTASLEILGQLNPLAQPLALDIKGKVRDLELPPLSPYSVKYAGHGIERGKLAMDVSYQVQPDGQLVASNKLVLHQLTFGDKVEGAPASLPVRLAVALLADRNGVIDVDLPISGSLNDPEFRLGSIIFKMVMNLIAKAVTAPFSLLASAFGGGDELGQVAFPAGSAVLDAEGQAGLDKVARAMTERPALDMTVAGTASLEAERGAFKQERLLAMMQAEKRRAAVVAGKSAEGLAPVTAAERPALLRDVYRRAQIPRPRNLVGLLKELPPAEMESLLLASISVTEEQMRELALARGMAVEDYLRSRELPTERLFLGEAKLVTPDGKWSPRAELHLTAR